MTKAAPLLAVMSSAPSTAPAPAAPKPKDNDVDRFSWRRDGPSAGSIVFFTTQAVATYINTAGDLVIRQEACWDDDEDSLVIVPRDQVERLVLSIKNDFDL